MSNEVRKVRSTCWTCSAACGCLVTIKDGRPVLVEGDPDHPRSRGTMCAKGLSSLQMLYNPYRLQYPMRRTGDRGGGGWKRISWAEAIEEIAAKLSEIREKHGAERIAVAAGGSKPIVPYSRRFANILGTPNHGSVSHICSRPAGAVARSIVGSGLENDVENSRCIVSVGGNWLHTQWAQHCYAVEYMNARRKGAAAITIDPRLSMTAARSDMWLRVRPGTDAALLLAWLNVIIGERLYDEDFVNNWTVGFDQLREHVKQFTPEWAEKITWVPADQIKKAARLYATTKPACITHGVPIEQINYGTSAMQAQFSLAAITGNIEVDGGNVFETSPIPAGHTEKLMNVANVTREMHARGLGTYPLNPTLRPGFVLWESMLNGVPYEVKALILTGGNPMISHENTAGLVYGAFKKVDFLAVSDLFMTPSAAMADIVLPAVTWLERDDMNTRGRVISASPKVVEPIGEARDDAEVFMEILDRMGLDYGAKSQREYLDLVLSSINMKYTDLLDRGYLVHPQQRKKYEKGLLRRDGKPGFNTPSGKVELYCERFASLGLSPLPVYGEPPESPYSTPELYEKYPLIVTDGRRPVYLHTQHRQVPNLRSLAPFPEVEINRRTAKELGISDDDWVWIEGVRGRCRQKAKLSNSIDPRVVYADFGWWYPEESAEKLHGTWISNINLLTSQHPNDPGCGCTSIRSMLCRVYKCSGEDLA